MATVECDKCGKEIGFQNILWVCEKCGARYCHAPACGQGKTCKNGSCRARLVRVR